MVNLENTAHGRSIRLNPSVRKIIFDPFGPVQLPRDCKIPREQFNVFLQLILTLNIFLEKNKGSQINVLLSVFIFSRNAQVASTRQT